MRVVKLIVISGLMLIFAGCVPSLHPLYTEKDITFDSALVGIWAEEGKEDECKWTFQKGEENSYELILTEKGTSNIFGSDKSGRKEIISKFVVYLLRLGEFTFMDMYPLEIEPEIKGELYKWHFIPAHTIWKVSIEGDILHLSILNSDWLNKMLEQKKINIGHEFDDYDFRAVLTASTKELQEFVLTHARNDKAFPEPMELHRQK